MKVNDGSKARDVVIIGSPNVNPGYKLVGNTVYPGITEDFEKTFRVLKSLSCDYFLGAHGSYFDLETKYPKFKAGDARAFIDPAGYKNYVEDREQAFRRELKKQKSSIKLRAHELAYVTRFNFRATANEALFDQEVL